MPGTLPTCMPDQSSFDQVEGALPLCNKKKKAEGLPSTFHVQIVGLEPTPKYMDMNLNHTRMPIPPYLHLDAD